MIFSRALSRFSVAGEAASSASRPEERAEVELISLYEEMRTPVMRYLLSCRIPIHDAEEILQEVFLLLFRNLQSTKASVHPAGWIFRTAHHFVLKHREKTRRQFERFQESGHSPETIADRSTPADQIVEATQRQNRLLAVVRALPEQDQSCLALRAEGLRYREISETLGMSLGAVAHSLQRSLARLARADPTRAGRR